MLSPRPFWTPPKLAFGLHAVLILMFFVVWPQFAPLPAIIGGALMYLDLPVWIQLFGVGAALAPWFRESPFAPYLMIAFVFSLGGLQWMGIAWVGGRALAAIRDRASRLQCRHCSYNLTGNTSGICPECGTPISES